jgi:uncharacterized protein YcbX
MSADLFDIPLAAVATGLFVYPVKACAGLAVDALTLDAQGTPVGDRGWAIVDAEGVLTWQGSHPRLALVAPRFVTAQGDPAAPSSADDDAVRLALGAPGVGPVLTPAASACRPCTAKIHDERTNRHVPFAAADAGDEVAAWLQAVTGAPLRLVRLGAAARRREGVNALHVVFESSVAAVDAELAQVGAPPADRRRYRPNVVLGGTDAPLDAFIEDSVAALSWQGAGAPTRLEVTAPCVRCIVPSVDPATGTITPATGDALAALSRRRQPEGPVVFGLYARGEPGTRLSLGDTATLTLAF